jgi:hypothetical protein
MFNHRKLYEAIYLVSQQVNHVERMVICLLKKNGETDYSKEDANVLRQTQKMVAQSKDIESAISRIPPEQ